MSFPSFTEIITDPDEGLLSRLNNALASDFDNFQIRPYLFNGTADRGVDAQGIQYGKYTTRVEDHVTIDSQEVRVGYLVHVVANDLAALNQAKEISVAIQRTVAQWSKRCTKFSVCAVKDFDGFIDIVPDREVSSEEQNAWYGLAEVGFVLESETRGFL